MEELTNTDVPLKKVKTLPSTVNKSPLKSDEESENIISNGTGLFSCVKQC